MYEKLDKIREDLKKAQAKRDAADAKVKSLEAKLREEESLMIVSEVTAYKLSPEQLAHFLQLVGSGKIQEMLNGQVAVPAGNMTSGNADKYGNSDVRGSIDLCSSDPEDVTENDEEEENFIDEENE